ncbi:MAG: hypothetical protein BGO11_06170 [Solirubrobacterales bacterium 70-9]|nr:MAG: hypothetical protein BGO11_06170 [Solirubrobacterales bacterium 70-9]
MNLKRLWYVITVAEEAHFGRAAARLRISQPSLSQQIKTAESELGVRLFDRDAAGVKLTAAGRELVGDGESLLAGAQRLADRVASASATISGRLNISYSRSAAHLGIGELVDEFRRDHPQVAIHTSTAWTTRNLEQLDREEVDIAFVRPPLEDDRPLLDLGGDDLAVAVPSDHDLVGRQPIDPAWLSGEPVVFWPREQGPGYHDSILGQVWRTDPPRVTLEEPEAELILEAVARGRGITVLDRRRALRMKPVGVAILAFRPPAPNVRLGVTWRPGDRSAAVQAFVDLCRRATTAA